MPTDPAFAAFKAWRWGQAGHPPGRKDWWSLNGTDREWAAFAAGRAAGLEEAADKFETMRDGSKAPGEMLIRLSDAVAALRRGLTPLASAESEGEGRDAV